MKTKQLVTLMAIAFFAFSLSSCKKNTEAAVEEIETTFEISGDQAVADNLTQDAVDVMEEAAAKNNLLGATPSGSTTTTNNWLPPCVIITVTGNFPAKNIKLDFGTGCTNNGIFRKGIMNIVLTDSIRNSGSVATITFDNYYVNTFKKEGTITWTNTSTPNVRSWNRQVANGKITAADGKYWLHTSNMDITQTAGVNTPLNITDDVFSLSGTKTVTNAAGKSRTSTTQTPLQKKTSCSNIDQGILKVQGPNHYALIDFGDGTCNNLATISIDGRAARTIVLR
ncbi:hypothetical protein [Ferruginibacter sp.]|nr:hypothetical protein [Ferruginibacter sp.]